MSSALAGVATHTASAAADAAAQAAVLRRSWVSWAFMGGTGWVLGSAAGAAQRRDVGSHFHALDDPRRGVEQLVVGDLGLDVVEDGSAVRVAGRRADGVGVDDREAGVAGTAEARGVGGIDVVHRADALDQLDVLDDPGALARHVADDDVDRRGGAVGALLRAEVDGHGPS